MEFLHILYSIIFTIFFLLALIIGSSNLKKKSPKSLPPGPPWKIPVIGHMHHLLGSPPHHSLRNLAQKYRLPVMHLQLGEASNVIISSPEATKEIIKTHDHIFANRPHRFTFQVLFYDCTDIASSSYGSYWSQLKKLCTLQLLTAKKVQSFRLIREEEVSKLVRRIFENEGSEVNISNNIMSMTNTIIARAAFGERSKDQEAFLKWAKEALNLIGGFYIADFFPSIKLLREITGMRSKLERVHRELDRIFENIIEDHKEKRRCGKVEQEDLVDVLLRVHQQNDMKISLSLNNIKAVLLDMFFGGTESSSTTVLWAMSSMLKNPITMEKAQAEVRRVFRGKTKVDETELHQLEYLQCVIKETLRLYPPFPFLIPRRNSQACIISGYEIPANSEILINAWAIQRDPKYWNQPEKFNPERFLDSSVDYNFRGTNFEYIPFGGGRRICPGITFATPNVELPLASLLYHFDWKLPNGINHEEFDMSESLAGSLIRKSDLCLIPISYQSP